MWTILRSGAGSSLINPLSRASQADENRVQRRGSLQGIWSVFAKKLGLNRKPGPPVHDDFVKRDCRASKANELWLTEIIEHPTKDGKLYLCAVKDVYSGVIERLLNGLTDEIPIRGERIGKHSAVTPANSHGGSNGAGISISFTALGSVPATPWTDWHDGPGGSTDNAAMESFFLPLKKNLLNRQQWASRQELRLAIVTWIEKTHHRRRRQRRLGKLTPFEYETSNQTAHSAA